MKNAVLFVWLLLFLFGCDKCQKQSDCEAKEICSNGKCLTRGGNSPFGTNTTADTDSEFLSTDVDTNRNTDSDSYSDTHSYTNTETDTTNNTESFTTNGTGIDTRSTVTSTTTTTDTGSSDIIAPCEGECLYYRYDFCTCAPSDPCGWTHNGICDAYCIEGRIRTDMFDGEDNGDCQGPCNGMCGTKGDTGYIGGYYTVCTCGKSDPCSWQGNGICDDFCTKQEVVEAKNMFDDRTDCIGQ